MADSGCPVSPALSTDCFPGIFGSVHYYPLSIMICLGCSSPLKITTEIARHDSTEKVKVKDNQRFHSRKSSPLKSRGLWLGKRWIPVSNSMTTRGKLMNPYLHMWRPPKGRERADGSASRGGNVSCPCNEYPIRRNWHRCFAIGNEVIFA
jgi:hypothetical protein